jgi:hypothetical protein
MENNLKVFIYNSNGEKIDEKDYDLFDQAFDEIISYNINHIDDYYNIYVGKEFPPNDYNWDDNSKNWQNSNDNFLKIFIYDNKGEKIKEELYSNFLQTYTYIFDHNNSNVDNPYFMYYGSEFPPVNHYWDVEGKDWISNDNQNSKEIPIEEISTEEIEIDEIPGDDKTLLKVYVFNTRGEKMKEDFYSEFLNVYDYVLQHNTHNSNDPWNIYPGTEFPPRGYKWSNDIGDWVELSLYEKYIRGQLDIPNDCMVINNIIVRKSLSTLNKEGLFNLLPTQKIDEDLNIIVDKTKQELIDEGLVNWDDIYNYYYLEFKKKLDNHIDLYYFKYPKTVSFQFSHKTQNAKLWLSLSKEDREMAKMFNFDGFILLISEFKDSNKYYSLDDIENELDILKVINASFIGRQNPLETVMGSSDRTRRVMRLIGDYNFLRLFGQVGFAQGSELGSVLGEVGWSTALRTMPELKNIMNRFISGKVAFNDPLLKELDAAGGLNLGLDRFMNSPSARLEGSEDFLSLDKSNVLNNLEIISAKAKRFVADVSLQNPMTSTTQIMGAKALTSKIAENMIVLSDIHKTTDIYKFLKLGDQVRYRQLGWTENQFNEISKNIKQHAKFENSYLKSLGLDDWSVEARSSFTVGLNRWIDKIAAQQTDLATMNKWFTTDFAKLLTQFRTFSIQAYEKQLLNGIYTLHQTRGKDFETWSRFFSSTLMSGLFYTTQVYINSFGLRDREEYLKEKLSASNIGRVSFLRSSWSSLLPLGASTIAYPFTSDDIFGYGRNTELSADLLSGIPTFNLFSNIIGSTRTLSKTITDPTYEPSEREIRNGLSLFILHNGLGIKNVNNMVVDYFAK